MYISAIYCSGIKNKGKLTDFNIAFSVKIKLTTRAIIIIICYYLAVIDCISSLIDDFDIKIINNKYNS